MAAKKNKGSKPFAGQTGRKPNTNRQPRGKQGYGTSSGSGKNKVDVRVKPGAPGQTDILIKSAKSGKAGVAKTEEVFNSLLKSKAAGLSGAKTARSMSAQVNPPGVYGKGKSSTYKMVVMNNPKKKKK